MGRISFTPGVHKRTTKRIPAGGIGTSKSRAFLNSLSNLNISGYIINSPTRTSANIRTLTLQAREMQIILPSNMPSNNAMATEILSLMGCSLINDDVLKNPHYSLVNDQTDTEVVDNPNKFDANFFKNLKNETIQINNVFKNTEDSIFNLDPEIPLDNQKINQQIKAVKNYTNCTNVVSKIISLNFVVPGVPTIRAFKGI